jgi:ferritin-like metal-binding protein YciE
MFEKFDTPEELFEYKLGAALNMEHKVLGMLGDLQEKTHNDEARRLFGHHAEETRRQIGNLEEAFRAIGKEPDKNALPAFAALEQQAKLDLTRTDDRIVDLAILSGAIETEHYESAVYESLIAVAGASGHGDLTDLLRQNLEMEQHTLDEVRGIAQKVTGAPVGSAA